MDAGEDDITREIRIEARPEIVFELLTDPNQMVRWMGTVAELEPRPAGIYRVALTSQWTVRGSYVEVIPNRRVAFSWGWEGNEAVPPGSTTVEITLIPDGTGTIVRLVHRGLPVPARDSHAQGWDKYLSRLAVAASGGEPGPDTTAATM